MSAGDVAHLACRREHPVRGDRVLCDRQRWHGGDHRGVDEARDELVSWPDPSAYVTPGAFPEHGPMFDPLPGDFDTLEPVREVGGGPWAWVPYVEVATLVMFLCGLPPAVVLVWAAFFQRF